MILTRRRNYDSLSVMLSNSSDIRNAVPADPLSNILQDLRLAGVSYGRCELTQPWGVEFPAQRAARFHFVAEGECRLYSPVIGAVHLQAGDVVLLPHGTEHSLVDRSESAATPLDDLPMQEIGIKTYGLTTGGGGERTLLFCGSVSFEEPAVHPLLELMPPSLLVRGAAGGDPALPALLEMMGDEVIAQRVGAATVMARLADIIITRIVRAWVETERESAAGWLAAIRDPKIGLALAAIHRDPGNTWSVESLADIAGASRSVFSERFTNIMGVSPARYLARWRMHVASAWLRNARLTVAQTADRLGYESEASFSRAYKRLMGAPPSSARRIDQQP